MPDGLQHPEPNLQATALRYAAGDLTTAEASEFEALLAVDQRARDALSEAVRLSAAALGQSAPAPDRSFRAAIRERLLGYCPTWLARRAYRGHPLAWAGLGAVAVAACTVIGLALAERTSTATPAPSGQASPSAGSVALAPAPHTVAPAPAPSSRDAAPTPHETESFVANASAPTPCGTECGSSVAEIWAQLSTPEHVEKAHDEELKWRQKLHNAATLHPSRPMQNATIDSREP
jgi:hypothetical protein